MKTPRKNSKNKAFTLIEMLVVVAVMAIIVAIAIPALSSSRTDANQTSAEARAKVLNEARDRAILKEVIPEITSREQWDAYWDNPGNTSAFTGDNAPAQAAAAFLISNNLIRVKDLQ
jgi:prepilin-type N-terminal cleavage/methylation domain-containing protein